MHLLKEAWYLKIKKKPIVRLQSYCHQVHKNRKNLKYKMWVRMRAASDVVMDGGFGCVITSLVSCEKDCALRPLESHLRDSQMRARKLTLYVLGRPWYRQVTQRRTWRSVPGTQRNTDESQEYGVKWRKAPPWEAAALVTFRLSWTGKSWEHWGSVAMSRRVMIPGRDGEARPSGYRHFSGPQSAISLSRGWIHVLLCFVCSKQSFPSLL